MAEVVSSAELFNNAPNSNLPPFDVVVPKGVDPEAMAKDIVGGKIDVSKINTLVSSKELFGDETPTIKTVSSADLFKDEKPVTPKVTPKREKTLTDKVIGFAQKYLGDQTPAETGSGEATKGFVQGLASVASGGASWIPAGLSMTPITIDGKGVKLRSPQEMADTARAIQESLTYTPKDKSAREFAEALAKPITYVIEKGKDSGDYYKKLGDEAEARGEHKTAKLLWALGGATEVGGEALPFAVPYAAGKGLKAVKGAVKAPEIDLGKVSEKPTSITPDVSAELKKALPKEEVKAPEVKAKPVEKVDSAANVDPLITEARKYKTAEEFVKAQETKTVDEQGVTHVGDFVELYHGTSSRRANKIATEGLGIRKVKNQTMGGDSESSRNYIWFAKKSDAAKSYSEHHTNPKVVTVRIPKDVYEKMENGPVSAWTKQEVPAQYIYNPEKVKADLTSIWNKAQEGKKSIPKAEVKPEMPAEGKPAKAALDINKDLIEKGFEGLPERELARYSTIQKVEEVGKAQALVSNPDFFEMAKGNKPIPEDVHPQVLFNVAINEATKAGNIDMLMDLAKSPIAEQRSLAAQQLGASAWEKPVNNIVKTINEVKKVRESKIKNPKVKEVVKTKLREEVSKINLSKEELNWEKFLSKIEC